jgi:AbrB family looped-hinge helix DNA binding protein
LAEAKLSSKNQIVVPREAREALGVKAGDKLLVVVRGKSVIILPRPKSWTKAIRGLAGGRYPENYLAEERASWD